MLVHIGVEAPRLVTVEQRRRRERMPIEPVREDMVFRRGQRPGPEVAAEPKDGAAIGAEAGHRVLCMTAWR